MNIVNYDQALHEPFAALVADYFIRELESDIPEDIVRGKLMELILKQWEQQILHIAIALEDGSPVGFSIYQIDTPKSDWCKREGWGFIREFYVSPGHRKQGIGSALAEYSDIHLRQLGAAQIYLTSDNAIPFWLRCGYRDSGEQASNGLNILEK